MSALAQTERLYIIDPDTGCWVWQRTKSANGYGLLPVDGKTYYAHRISYQLHRGPIGRGREIDHLCRNRACMNPDHLEVVTRAVNSRRGAKAKLTVEAVAEIRAAPSTVAHAELGRRFGVGEYAVAMARKGITWGDAT